jgi:AcrR family transcriptional regulator
MTTVTLPAGRRPRQRLERRGRIEAAALDLFRTQGVEGTTVQQITDAADVAKGTFFNYFTSKHDVLAQRLSRLADAILAFTQAPGPDEPLARLRRYFESAEALFRKEGPQMLLLYREALVRPDLRTIDSDAEDRVLDFYAGLLCAGQRSGRLRPGFDPQLGAQLINDIWASTLRSWMSCAGRFPFAERLSEKIALVFDGFRAARG